MSRIPAYLVRNWMFWLVGFVTCGGVNGLVAETAASRRPNVVILFPDQLRASSVACYGDPVARTPAMDRLAAEGVRFEQGFSNAPVCSPARSVLLTSRYIRSNGVRNNQDSEATYGRPSHRETTLAEAFAQAGYSTALVGKWHLAPTPQALGFQKSLRANMRHRYYNQTYYRNEERMYVHPDYAPYHETDAAAEYIRQHRDNPFFLYVAYGPPHMPVAELPERYRSMYDPQSVPMRKNVFRDGKPAYDENWFKIYLWDFQYYNFKENFRTPMPESMDLRKLTALYYGQISAVDECVGRVLDALKENELEQDTIVLLSSDHGDMLGSHQLFNKNTLYEEAIRVPVIFRYPRQLKPRVESRQVASLVDMMPTLLEMCGIPAPSTAQGTSLAPVLAGQKETVGENVAYIEVPQQDGIRTLQYLYAGGRGAGGAEELYDLAKDPYEMSNIAGMESSKSVLESFRTQLRSWRQRTPRAEGDGPEIQTPARKSRKAEK